MTATGTCCWRDDIDSLAFVPPGHEGTCVVHRRALRTLLGFMPDVETCERFFAEYNARFIAAAARKIERAQLPRTANFHLNSRDIARS